ncbi:MAG: MBL fold metallo-hydrolase, partial [Nocardioides kribbensis]
DLAAIWPGHGPVIEQALPVLDHYRTHRRSRLEQVEAALATLSPSERAADDLARRVVEVVYADVDPVLWGAAELSVRAQLAYLEHGRPGR